MINPATKTIRLTLLSAYIIIAVFFVWQFRPIYLLSIIIVLVPPTLANFRWLNDMATKKRILAFSLLSLFLFAPPVELSARLANVWDVQSVFPRPFGLIPLENMLLAFLNFFWGLSFYAYFTGTSPSKSSRLRYLICLYLLLDLVVFSGYFLNPTLIKANYFALALPILIVPAVLLFCRYPALIRKTLPTTLFFAVVLFLYETVSLEIGSWWWPGTYLYALNFNGHIFLLDDILIWYFLSTPVLIAGYEFFANGYGEKD